MKMIFSIICLSVLIGLTLQSIAQPKVLFKEKGVSLSYDVEFVETCYNDLKETIEVKEYRYTIYLSNETDENVAFVQPPGAFVRGTTSCRSKLTPQASAVFPTRIKANSEITRTVGVIIGLNQGPPRPNYNVPGFKFLY